MKKFKFISTGALIVFSFAAGTIFGGSKNDYLTQEVLDNANDIVQSRGGDAIPETLLTEVGARDIMQSRYLVWLDTLRLQSINSDIVELVTQFANDAFLAEFKESEGTIGYSLRESISIDSGQQFSMFTAMTGAETMALKLSNKYGGWCSYSYDDRYECQVPFLLKSK